MSRAILKTGTVIAMGMMSGTSLDGVDAAILETDGERIVRFGPTSYRRYTDAEQTVLRAALGQWNGPAVDAATEVVETAHLALLKDMPPADIIGFHGQTLAHAPRVQGTLQAGRGTLIAQAAGAPVIWDFRSSDIELGGEGAPLAPFYHFACAKYIGAGAPLVFLNLGGVGNLTYLDPRFERPEEPGALLSFDTGPANAPLNDLMLSRRGQAFDEGGAVARQGQVEHGALELFLAEPYFSRMPPKSLDRNDFAQMIELVCELPDADAAATLTAMSAAAVVEGMRHLPALPQQVLVTGGGRLNPVMMEMLQAGLDCPVDPVEVAGLDGDMLEAQAFAHLAVRVARGLPTSCPGTTGVRAAVGGGQISLPESRSPVAQA
ncbi:MAG: anhydro-N-acetylmuramic acid kinase [Pseudomonadota bacterium]